MRDGELLMALDPRDTPKLLLRAAISAGLLIWVFAGIDVDRFLSSARHARWFYVVAVWAVTAVTFLVAAMKMEYILRRQNCGAGLSVVFAACAATALYAMVMPGLLSTGVKWYILRRRTGSGTTVLSSMIYNQLSDLIVMLVTALAVLAITNPFSLYPALAENRILLPAACVALLIVVLGASFLAIHRTTGAEMIRVVSIVGRVLPAALGTKLTGLLDRIAVFPMLPWQFHLVVALITALGRVACNVAMYVLAAWAVNISVPVIVLVWLSATVMILRMLPISIANLGPREATLVVVLGGYGVATSDALLMSMVLFSGTVFMAVVGAVSQVLWRPVPLADGMNECSQRTSE